MFLFLKTNCSLVTCAFLASETMEKLTELITFKALKTTLLIRLRFQGYRSD